MKNSKTFSVRFWLKKRSKTKNGKVPVYARIVVDGRRADISLKRTTLEAHWCPVSGRSRARHPGARCLNEYLDDVYARLMDCHKQLHRANELITAQTIKRRYLGVDKKVSTLFELLKYHRERELIKLEPGTAKNYKATEKYLARFIQQRYKLMDIKLLQLDYSFIMDFDYFLRNCQPIKRHQKLTNNGIMKHMERFKKILSVAYRYSWIKQNPFSMYQLKFTTYESAFLEASEIRNIEDLELTEQSLRLVRDIFIFSCYTGLGYIEVKLLKEGDIVKGLDGEDWIDVHRKKTRTPVKVPLLSKARAILDRYKNYPDLNGKPSLLPVFSNQKVNQYLKILAKKAGIEKHLTFHVARHTFATTITLLNDVPLETVSKLLGHTKLSTTQRYARVVEQKISRDMMRLKSSLETEEKRSYIKTEYNHLQIVE